MMIEMLHACFKVLLARCKDWIVSVRTMFSSCAGSQAKLLSPVKNGAQCLRVIQNSQLEHSRLKKGITQIKPSNRVFSYKKYNEV